MAKLIVLILVVIDIGACASTTSVPSGPHPVIATFKGPGPSGCGAAPSIFASATLIGVTELVIGSCKDPSQCLTPGFACWAELQGQDDELYIAVQTANECNRATQDEVLVDANTLYWVHSISRPKGVCNAMMALPSYELFTVPRSVLPPTRMLKVELQVKTEGEGTNKIDTEVDLS